MFKLWFVEKICVEKFTEEHFESSRLKFKAATS